MLRRVQHRVLWLATAHRPPRQPRPRRTPRASRSAATRPPPRRWSAIMTALWFDAPARGRPGVGQAARRAGAARHQLPARPARPRYLTKLREFGGLQSYPSRTKDPDPVDFSTGSVGIGATATICGARWRTATSPGTSTCRRGGRQIALLGDAELDEGAIWEALVDPMVPTLGEVLWVVDLNRQSLDRVVPDIAAGRIGAMFDAAGWHTITVKYGAPAARAVRAPGRRGAAPPDRRDDQRGVPAPAARARGASCASGCPADGDARRSRELLADLEDAELHAAIRDLGGHDLGDLLDAFREADAARRPPVGRLRLHDQGLVAADRGPPGQPLRAAQRRAVGRRWPTTLGADPPTRGRASPTDSAEAGLCAAAARGSTAAPPARVAPPPAVPPTSAASTAAARRPSRRSGASSSTSRTPRPTSPRASSRSAPTSRSSTNLGGWINNAGVWSRRRPHRLVRRRHRDRWCAGARPSTASTSSWASPRSTWSGCSASWAPPGHATASRCCRSARSTTRSSPARSSRGRSASTPAASRSSSARPPASRSPPRAARTSRSITPSIGLEQPRCVGLGAGLRPGPRVDPAARAVRLGRADGESAYFRLSTRPIDQALAARLPDERPASARRRLPAAARRRRSPTADRGHGRAHARGRWRRPAARAGPA